MPRPIRWLLSLVFAGIVFAGINISVGTWVTNARLDLTENGRFTLSDGTKTIVRTLPEPVHLRFFYSRKAAADYPQLRAYGGRVRDLLQRYAALSHGKVTVEEIDPEAFSQEEDEATAAGMTAAPTENGEAVYFGLSGTNRLDGHETVAYFAPEREPYLEYDITGLIARLANPVRPKLALLSPLPLDGSNTGRPFAAYQELARNFDTTVLAPDFTTIPPGTRVLMIVAPGALSDAQLFAIDQFALKGGRIALFVDPDSELSAALRGLAPYMSSPQPATLARLLKAWGIGFDTSKEVADLKLAQKVQTTNDPRHAVSLYPAWLHITEGFDGDDPVSASLQSLNLASSGALFSRKGARTKITPLVLSSDRAGPVDTTTVHMAENPADVSDALSPTGVRYTLAARVTGPAYTAFPGGPPNGGQANDTTAPAAMVRKGDIHLIVVADSDLFDDRFWLRYSGTQNKPAASVIADNGAFILNIADNLMGSDALISLRTRGFGERPFTLVRALQADAEAQYRREAETLEARLSETQNRIKILSENSDSRSAHKRAEEMARFRQDLIRTRAALRDVQHNLRKDIDSLGSFLAFINIALMPLCIGFVALCTALWRRRKRRQAVKAPV